MNRKEIQNKLNELFEEKAQTIFNLQDRWEDEKEYEDFEDYKNVINKMFLEYGFSQTKLYKNFKITTILEGKNVKDFAVEIEIKIYKSGKIEFYY